METYNVAWTLIKWCHLLTLLNQVITNNTFCKFICVGISVLALFYCLSLCKSIFEITNAFFKPCVSRMEHCCTYQISSCAVATFDCY